MPQEETEAESEVPSIRLDTWAIRPSMIYKEEYNDCTSLKARFHQYFIHGETTDCSQWKKDYENCLRYEESNGNDMEAGKAIIKSEEARRAKRLQAHYGNTTWKKRQNPPSDWSGPLPEWLMKRNENTYLELKSAEMKGLVPVAEETKSYCLIM